MDLNAEEKVSEILEEKEKPKKRNFYLCWKRIGCISLNLSRNGKKASLGQSWISRKKDERQDMTEESEELKQESKLISKNKMKNEEDKKITRIQKY